MTEGLKLQQQVERHYSSNVQNIEGSDDILNRISDILSKTLGPHGSTTIIESHLLDHQVSKDGYTVLSKLIFTDSYSRVLLELIKKISNRLVRTVGDGSTSAVVASASFFNRLKEFTTQNPHIPPQELLNALKIISSNISMNLKHQSTQIDGTEECKDILRNIAYISTNGDVEVSQLVADVVERTGREGIIALERSKSDQTHIVEQRGFTVHRGYVDSCFANRFEERGNRCDFGKTMVFICDGRLDAADLPILLSIISNRMKVGGDAFVVVANGYNDDVLNTLRGIVASNNGINICLIDHATNSSSQLSRLNDLAMILGATVYQKRTKNISPDHILKLLETTDILGYCDKFECNDSKSSFIDGKGKEEDLNLYIARLRNQLQEMVAETSHIDTSTQEADCRRRLAVLTSGAFTIFVGGDSEQEKDAKKYLVEDAVFAARSALRHGIVPGGMLAIPRMFFSNENMQSAIAEEVAKKSVLTKEQGEELVNGIVKSFIDVYSHIIAPYAKYHSLDPSSYIVELIKEGKIVNMRTFKEESIEESRIVNSVETDTEILKAVVSIIGLVATSNQFIFLPQFVK